MQKVYFFGSSVGKATDFLSQWYPSPMVIDGKAFANAEQKMMYDKAALFGDEQAMQKILATSDPKRCKALGRQVKGFNEQKWIRGRERIVYEANMAKFSQNPVLRARLKLYPMNTRFIEASPYDRVWGIGFSATHAERVDESEWGLNLLGLQLTRVRNELE